MVTVIAEFGMLHEGSLGTACKMAEVAKVCGADAVKFQTHIAEAETLRDAPVPPFFRGEPRWEYFTRTAFTREQWAKLKAHCDAIGIEFLSTPFSIAAIELLESVGMARYKIPSGEVTNTPFLERIAETRKPVFLSSGMSDWAELDAAVAVFQRHGNPLTVFQCSTIYPTPPERIGLNVILAMRERYHCSVGLSDQSLTISAGLAAAALGVSAIEKHVTLSRHCYGSDAAHSVEPKVFAAFVRAVREIEAMHANPVNKDDLTPYREMKRVFEKSVVSMKPIPAGATITADMVAVKKPGGGIPPRDFDRVIGGRALRDIPADHVLVAEDIAFAHVGHATASAT
jgi:N-acetylneuraminate synthase